VVITAKAIQTMHMFTKFVSDVVDIRSYEQCFFPDTNDGVG